jgi:PadR family transcriptional regulator PadR
MFGGSSHLHVPTTRASALAFRGIHGQVLKGHLDGMLLAALTSGPAHGYAIIESLRAASGGAFDLPEGTVYPALHRMEQAGLVSSRWSRDTGRRRRVYTLTAKGQRELVRRRGEWRQFAGAMQAVLEGGR